MKCHECRLKCHKNCSNTYFLDVLDETLDDTYNIRKKGEISYGKIKRILYII